MSNKAPENDFSYRLTESLLSQPCNSSLSLLHQPSNPQLTPRIIAHSPSVTEQEEKETNTQPNKPHQDATLWTYLSQDFDSSSIGTQDQKSILSDHSFVTTSTEFFSKGAYFFLFGFIFPPCWWIGSFYPKGSKNMYIDGNMKMALRWRLLNRFFSLGFSCLLIISIIVLAILYSKN
ncbi:hypothetical protein EDC94DRAFT_697284 [Helicostylum pulchrum]|uniref:Uncharacterized protein n=1 Tax=Helicostylum pulchrum TaxID=562976 RepID=A0ABP9XLY2_9FUNG|nr:hypothetical protein EDC94DRAFT_697284 [Helicostylum pulchrum]